MARALTLALALAATDAFVPGTTLRQRAAPMKMVADYLSTMKGREGPHARHLPSRVQVPKLLRTKNVVRTRRQACPAEEDHMVGTQPTEYGALHAWRVSSGGASPSADAAEASSLGARDGSSG